MRQQLRAMLPLGVILMLAALVRVVNLPARGEWDADQGAHMLAVLAWIRDGVVPLVGPASSLGEAHHGVLYYWLLAPGAALTDTHPLAAVLTVLAVGIAGVAAVWGAARAAGGELAGVVAGTLAALSPTWIQTSTFIWNPNLVAPGAAIAMMGAWRAWTTAHSRWWAVSVAGLVLAVEGHLLAAAVVPPFLVLLVIDARREVRSRRGSWRQTAALAAACVVIAGAPLVMHELQTGFSELRSLVAFLSGSSGDARPSLAEVGMLTLLRSLSWPLVGLIVAAPVLAVATAGAVVAAGGWRYGVAAHHERAFVAWAAATTAWCVIILALLAPALAMVVPETPVDHYHAVLDPIVFVIVALGIAGVGARVHARPSRLVIVSILTALVVAAGLPAWPPITSPDGGWPAARDAAERIAAAAGGEEIALVSVPAIKTAEAYEFPLRRARVPVTEDAATAGVVVVVCDRLFREVVGADCGGPAEDERLAGLPGVDAAAVRLKDRFSPDPRRMISVYVAR